MEVGGFRWVGARLSGSGRLCWRMVRRLRGYTGRRWAMMWGERKRADLSGFGGL